MGITNERYITAGTGGNIFYHQSAELESYEGVNISRSLVPAGQVSLGTGQTYQFPNLTLRSHSDINFSMGSRHTFDLSSLEGTAYDRHYSVVAASYAFGLDLLKSFGARDKLYLGGGFMFGAGRYAIARQYDFANTETDNNTAKVFSRTDTLLSLRIVAGVQLNEKWALETQWYTSGLTTFKSQTAYAGAAISVNRFIMLDN